MPPISYGVMNSAEIETAACAAATALRACGLRGCLFGSAACMLYGTTRTPNVRPLNLSLFLIADLYFESIGYRPRGFWRRSGARGDKEENRSRRSRFLSRLIYESPQHLQDSMVQSSGRCAPHQSSLQGRYPHSWAYEHTLHLTQRLSIRFTE